MGDTAEVLRAIPMFALLDDHERGLLAERVDLVELRAGETLFHYGDPGGSMYVLKSGEVEIFVKTKTGERVILETAGPGDFFGEISLLDGGARTAAAEVRAAGEAILVDRGDLDELVRLAPPAAMDLLAASGRRLRQTSALLRNTATRNVNEEVEDTRTIVLRVADWVAAFSGSLTFLMLHVGLFSAWILLNVGALPFGGFDPFPFGLLTMIVSLEAIILSTLLLFSSNRQAERDRVHSDIEYDVNLKAELQIQHLHEKVDAMHAEILARMERLARGTTGAPPPR